MHRRLLLRFALVSARHAASPARDGGHAFQCREFPFPCPRAPAGTGREIGKRQHAGIDTDFSRTQGVTCYFSRVKRSTWTPTVTRDGPALTCGGRATRNGTPQRF